MFWSTVKHFLILKAQETWGLLKKIAPGIGVGVGVILPGTLLTFFGILIPSLLGIADPPGGWEKVHAILKIMTNSLFFYGLLAALCLIGLIAYCFFIAPIIKTGASLRRKGLLLFMKDGWKDLRDWIRLYKGTLIFWMTAPLTGFAMFWLTITDFTKIHGLKNWIWVLFIAFIAGVVINAVLYVMGAGIEEAAKFLRDNWREARRLAKKQNEKEQE